jgi:predicted transcriptional regulator of viral defense system
MSSKASINNWLLVYTELLLAHGRYSFSLSELRQAYPVMSEVAIKSSLKRLSTKGKILSWSKGYYLIITPEYANSGVLPPHLFLDDFMNHLNRSYYVGLLNAAVYHGASHQQPQEYFIFTSFPVMRPIQKNGLRLNCISIKQIPSTLLEKRKTEAGYLLISKPVLTACDLIHYEKRIGGLARASSVLMELTESIQSTDFTPELLRHVPITVLQRLGYVWEFICEEIELADALFEFLRSSGVQLFRIPLKNAVDQNGFSSINRWQVIENVALQIDDIV